MDSLSGMNSGLDAGGGETCVRDGRDWRIGTEAQISWIKDAAAWAGDAIPAMFDAYATVELPGTGHHKPTDLLAQRDKLNADVQKILDQNTEAWGIKVSNVEIKDVDLDESMIRAMAKQAEAERTRRAKIIHAEGEAQAAEMLVQAAESLARQPSAMQLRYLQTLADISHEKTQIIVFPLPLDLIKPLLGPRGE